MKQRLLRYTCLLNEQVLREQKQRVDFTKNYIAFNYICVFGYFLCFRTKKNTFFKLFCEMTFSASVQLRVDRDD